MVSALYYNDAKNRNLSDAARDIQQLAGRIRMLDPALYRIVGLKLMHELSGIAEDAIIREIFRDD